MSGKPRDEDAAGRDEERKETDQDRDPAQKPAYPPAGPHAKPSLTNEEATPGAGTLPSEDDEGDAAVSS